MSTDKLQLQRLELKYHVNEDTALAIREFVRCYLAVDEFGEGQPNLSYPVHSLYLDSDDLRIYWETVGGNMNRYKLRIRYYDDREDSPVFFEIKRRQNMAILKQRGAVHRRAVDLILAGQFPLPEDMLSKDPRQYAAIQRFVELMLANNARPKAHIAYDREAWVSTTDNSVRVTMDRNVQGAPEPTSRLGVDLHNPARPFGKIVILELKFTGRYPNWFSDLVRVFNLKRDHAAKYVDSVMLKGDEWFGPELFRLEEFARRGRIVKLRNRHHGAANSPDAVT